MSSEKKGTGKEAKNPNTLCPICNSPFMSNNFMLPEFWECEEGHSINEMEAYVNAK